MSAAIEKILREFDWDRVRQVMLALDWKWSAYSLLAFEPATPTVEQLKKAARDKLTYVAQPESTGYCASGGLVARREPDTGYLSLAFEVAHGGAQL